MNGSITLCREYNSNTSVYVVLGYYDTWKAQESAIKAFVKLLKEGKNDNVVVNTYRRPDGYSATYITISK